MWVIAKVLISGIIISGCSWLAGRKPVLAGFIIALPLMSLLSILFTYLEYRDMNKVSTFATSIVTAVPLSLTFFVPFILYRWLKWSFPVTYSLAILCLLVSYGLHHWVMNKVQSSGYVF